MGAVVGAVVVGLGLGLKYAVDNADTLLASPDDLPDDGSYDDGWADEVWSDALGSGTRDDPWPVGATVYGVEWDVVLGAPRDATAEILAADPAAGAPVAGTEYWVVPASAYYWGPGNSVSERESVRLGFVAADGTTYTQPCGAVPGELVTEGRVPVDSTRVGSSCVAVPAGADGVWRLTIGTSDPVYLADRSDASARS
ncbi:hypothetical protein [Cellulosimicrobium arenosum]|uniref:Uncharacterized protein n=1 Tax=Cellulosimicrobium arenosum TaxID=2708133 RepID=A0A927G770_9MICO|nr:hypothetical protein [Cellulosimicrobium arenosum]MBD8078176.1 hypothetical protein [Cellulosimicrobium arenosum]